MRNNMRSMQVTANNFCLFQSISVGLLHALTVCTYKLDLPTV